MTFTQQPINYAEQYARDLLNMYPYISYFNAIYNSVNSTKYKPINAKTVLIPSMTVSGATFVNRDRIDGIFERNFNIQYEAKTMAMDRNWSTEIDPMDIVETNEVATIANVTDTFNKFQKIPEMDCYAASKCASFAADFGGIDSTVLTSENILTQWDSYLAYMTGQRVNRDRCIAYMTTDTYRLLKEAAGITRFIDTGTGIRNIDRNVGKLDGVQIVEVPSDLMMTEYDYTQGFEPSSGAAQINMLLVDPDATIAPIVYDVSMMDSPRAATHGKNVYYERYYYDVFCANNRQAGFFANMTSPTLGILTVTSEAGASTGDTIITYSGTEINSAGIPWYGIDAYITTAAEAQSLTYGAALPSGVTWTKITGQNPVTLTSQTAGQYATVALVNKQKSVVIAGGNAVIVAGA